MTEENADLLKRAETALSGLSLREPDWDGLATRIEGAVGAAPPEDAALFDAPLPATDADETESPPITAAAPEPAPVSGRHEIAPPAIGASEDPGPTLSIAPESSDELDEGWSDAPEAASGEQAIRAAANEAEEVEAASEPAASDEAPKSPREGVSLADLARASVARRGSEATNIAKESLAVASQSRAQGVERAQRLQAASAVAPTSVAPPPPSARGGETLKGPWIGVAIAGIGLAAAFALVLSRPETSSAPVTLVEPAPEAPAAPHAEAPAPQAPTPKPEAPATEPAPGREATLDPGSLPTLPRETAPHADAKSGGGASKAPTPAPAPAAPGKVTAEKIVLEEDHKAAPKTAPSAGKPGDAKLRPAELSSDSMTDRPSAGAAQAAVGAVLGAARACVAGHPQPSSAQLVFSSDGQVQSVTVGGPAAGTPAAGCIESALKKARVQPFAASSFSLGVTVRPP